MLVVNEKMCSDDCGEMSKKRQNQSEIWQFTSNCLSLQKIKKMSKILHFCLILLGFFVTERSFAQNSNPSANPTMYVVEANGNEGEMVSFDGSAPMVATFTANVEDEGEYVPHYEWQFARQGETTPFLIRYEAETQYTFQESGSFTITLMVSFVHGTDTLEYVQDSPFVVSISESKLEVPNTFTPNGDGANDIFRVKEGYQSIVSFDARIFDRWGKLLFRWQNLDEGWDGKSGGRDVPDGAYYLHIKARGADGRNYNIKKVINILRGYTEAAGTGGG